MRPVFGDQPSRAFNFSWFGYARKAGASGAAGRQLPEVDAGEFNPAAGVVPFDDRRCDGHALDLLVEQRLETPVGRAKCQLVAYARAFGIKAIRPGSPLTMALALWIILRTGLACDDLSQSLATGWPLKANLWQHSTSRAAPLGLDKPQSRFTFRRRRWADLAKGAHS